MLTGRTYCLESKHPGTHPAAFGSRQRLIPVVCFAHPRPVLCVFELVLFLGDVGAPTLMQALCQVASAGRPWDCSGLLIELQFPSDGPYSFFGSRLLACPSLFESLCIHCGVRSVVQMAHKPLPPSPRALASRLRFANSGCGEAPRGSPGGLSSGIARSMRSPPRHPLEIGGVRGLQFKRPLLLRHYDTHEMRHQVSPLRSQTSFDDRFQAIQRKMGGVCAGSSGFSAHIQPPEPH